jgi:ubiquinone/menaquinone biosynthesis C-methylase UbiE
MDEKNINQNMQNNDFKVVRWQDQLKKSEAGDSKEFIYRFLRPAINLLTRKHLSKKTLDQFSPELVIREFGMPLTARKNWGSATLSLKGKTVLVQGTGNGWDVANWLKYKPKRIIGVDLYKFSSWGDITEFAKKEYNIGVEFHEAPLHDLKFLNDQSVDFVASDAVYEHVKNLPEVMQETNRILKSDGAVYATYGPLWYGPGGDHFSGRGGSDTIYNHLLLSEDDYKQYFEANMEKVENFQSGGRYVELDLFSKLKTDQYFEIFQKSGFIIDSSILELSTPAIRFKVEHPDRFKELSSLNETCAVDDFIIKANFVRLKKNG